MAPIKPTQPTSKAARSLVAKHLDVLRHGNDEYTVTELRLVGDGLAWRTEGAKVLVEHCSRNVASTYVEEWNRQHAGHDFMGASGL